MRLGACLSHQTQAEDSVALTKLEQLPPASPAARKRRLSWVRMIQKVFEIDPLLCGYCGSQMKIRSFTLELSASRHKTSSP